MKLTLHPEMEAEEPIIRRLPTLRHRTVSISTHKWHNYSKTPENSSNGFITISMLMNDVKEQNADIEQANPSVINLYCETIISQNAQSFKMSARAMMSLGEGLVKIGQGMLSKFFFCIELFCISNLFLVPFCCFLLL